MKARVDYSFSSDSIGVYELKTHLSSVLDNVVAGQVVTITRHGHPIARIQPIAIASQQLRREAVERMQQARAGRTLGISAQEAISQGRK